jgi:autotransporter-associated beta strand protein
MRVSGNVTINAGSLQIATEGNLGSLSNPVLLNGGNLACSQSLATTRTIQLNGGAIAVASGQSVSLDGSGSLSGSGGLIKTGPGTLLINRPRSYPGATQVSGGTLNLLLQPTELLSGGTLNSGVWIVESSSTLIMAGPAILTNKASVTLRGSGSSFSNLTSLNRNEGNLNIEGGRTFTTASSLINTGNITIGNGSGIQIATSLANTGTIDLSGALVVDYTDVSPLSAIAAQVQSGFAGGSWRGTGINSSSAASDTSKTIALAEASESGVAFNLFATDASSVIALCTTRGDANLDSQVNSLDFNLFTANYGKTTGALWTQGDFTADGRVNTTDFNHLAGNFGSGGMTPSAPLPIPTDSGTADSSTPSELGTSVPEPTTIEMMAAGIVLVRSRNRTWKRLGLKSLGGEEHKVGH